MSEAIFELVNVSYSYPNGVKAIENVSLKIHRGECVAIVGPNGAGKTTLLHMLDGLIVPSDGEIRIFGTPITQKGNYSWIRRKIGYVMQDVSSALFNMCVWDEVTFGLKQLNLSDEMINEIGEAILKRFEIEHLKERHPFHLSFGEKKKVLLASVLAIDPEVILLDEPTTEVDAKWRKWIIKFIKELNESEKKTVIVATHDMDAIPFFAKRVIVFNKEIIADGTIDTVFRNEHLISKANLDMPLLIKLFFEAKKANIFSEHEGMPLTIDNFLDILKESCKKENKT